MKTTCGYVAETILPVLLLAALIPSANAQNLTVYSLSRSVYNSLSSGDADGGPYSSTYPGTNTTALGHFSASDTEATPAAQHWVSSVTSTFQDSTISASSISLHVTGLCEVTASTTARAQQGSGGAAAYGVVSEVDILFTIDQPFTYTLRATTSRTSEPGYALSAYVALGHAGFLIPDVAAYGTSYQYGQYTAPSNAGTNSGTLPAGSYELRAYTAQSKQVTPPANSTVVVEEDFSASFTLDVTAPPQPPVMVALTPNGVGTFLLAWLAPQAGGYRVMASTNLVEWFEYTPAANQPSGPNTNTVNLIPGSSCGFFRIQYLP
jgi:hypothetical protein